MTPGAWSVLTELAVNAKSDLLQEGGIVYCGNRRTTTGVVHQLLRLTAISIVYQDGWGTPITHYEINDTGRALVRRQELAAEISNAMREGVKFSIIDDQIVKI